MRLDAVCWWKNSLGVIRVIGETLAIRRIAERSEKRFKHFSGGV